MSSPQSGASSYGSGGATGYSAQPGAGEYGYTQNSAQSLGEHTITEEGHPDVENVSVGQLLGEVSKDLSTLMRQELELAKAEVRADAEKASAEVKAQASKAGKGAGMLGGAGFAGYMLILFLSLAAMWGLSNLMDTGWAALIVAAIWGIVAAVLYSSGRKELKKVDFSGLKRINPKPEQTVDTLQQVPSALKPS